jgi:hypothetical protein
MLFFLVISFGYLSTGDTDGIPSLIIQGGSERKMKKISLDVNKNERFELKRIRSKNARADKYQLGFFAFNESGEEVFVDLFMLWFQLDDLTTLIYELDDKFM